MALTLTRGSLVEDGEEVDGRRQAVEDGEESQAGLQWLLFVQHQELDRQENQNTDDTGQNRGNEPGTHCKEITATGSRISLSQTTCKSVK